MRRYSNYLFFLLLFLGVTAHAVAQGRMKKLLLSFVFILSCSTIRAYDGEVFTAKTEEGIDMTFQVISESDKTCQVGTGSATFNSYPSGIVTIPSEANGYRVIAIGNMAFYSCSKLTSVVIPNSIVSIGNTVFTFCYSLTNISIPNQ